MYHLWILWLVVFPLQLYSSRCNYFCWYLFILQRTYHVSFIQPTDFSAYPTQLQATISNKTGPSPPLVAPPPSPARAGASNIRITSPPTKTNMTIAGKSTMNESMYFLLKNGGFSSNRHSEVVFRGKKTHHHWDPPPLSIPDSIFCHAGVCAKETSNLLTNWEGNTPSSRKTPQQKVEMQVGLELGHAHQKKKLNLCSPKNHGISKLVVWRSQNPAIHIQTPLFCRVQWFLGRMIFHTEVTKTLRSDYRPSSGPAKNHVSHWAKNSETFHEILFV